MELMDINFKLKEELTMDEDWKVFIRGNKDRGEEVIKALTFLMNYSFIRINTRYIILLIGGEVMIHSITL